MIKGAEKDLKEKINIIMAISLNGVIHYKMVNDSVDSKIF